MMRTTSWSRQLPIAAIRSLNDEADRDDVPIGRAGCVSPRSCLGLSEWGRFVPRPRRRMPHRFIYREPVPVDSTQLLKLLDACLPEFEEGARLPLASRSRGT